MDFQNGKEEKILGIGKGEDRELGPGVISNLPGCWTLWHLKNVKNSIISPTNSVLMHDNLRGHFGPSLTRILGMLRKNLEGYSQYKTERGIFLKHFSIRRIFTDLSEVQFSWHIWLPGAKLQSDSWGLRIFHQHAQLNNYSEFKFSRIFAFIFPNPSGLIDNFLMMLSF